MYVVYMCVCVCEGSGLAWPGASLSCYGVSKPASPVQWMDRVLQFSKGAHMCRFRRFLLSR